MAIKTNKLVVDPLDDSEPLLNIVGTENDDVSTNITTLNGPWYSGEAMPNSANWAFAGMVKIDINLSEVWIPVFRKNV